jgi:putative acetyltransferase
MTPEFVIRPETDGDRVAIHALHGDAFGGMAEATLVDALRQDGDLILSLVADAHRPVGHIAFSRLVLPEIRLRASALAPLAIVKERQRQGIGAALVKEGLRRLAEAGEDFVLVLGDPAYYGRFGFSPDGASGLRTPYDGPYLQALALSDAGRQAHGPVHYARAFAELG